VLAAEMETAALYTLAARHRARGLSILTVSDDILKGAAMTKEERERTLDEMITLALETVLALPAGK
jgi:purine-nucleoside phosphorylase